MSPERTARDAIRQAVDLAGHAPSLFNAQPWTWLVGADDAELSADLSRTFSVTDPQNREMMIGCGVALDHVQEFLAAAGWGCETQLSPDLDNPGLVARVRITGRREPDARAHEMADAIPRRRTDRRPFSTEPVNEHDRAALQKSAHVDGVNLQIVDRDEDRVWLAVLAERAATLQTAEAGYSAELAGVTGAADDSNGIPAAMVPHIVSPRHSDVPLRDFELLEPGTMQIAQAADEHPVWAVLWTDRDSPADWLLAGQALSKLLLTATAAGLSTGVQSQPVEVPMIRAQLNEHLLAELGHAQVLIRIGWPAHS